MKLFPSRTYCWGIAYYNQVRDSWEIVGWFRRRRDAEAAGDNAKCVFAVCSYYSRGGA